MFLVGTASAKAIINAPIESIDMGEWMFTLKSEEYAACAEGHQGAAQGRLGFRQEVFGKPGGRGRHVHDPALY